MLGVLFMCAACALFPIMNGFVKLLAATYDPKQIVWFRIIVHLVLVALVFMPRMGLDLFRTQRIGSQFVNSVMMLLSTLFFFSAVEVCRRRRGDLDQLRGAARRGVPGLAAAGRAHHGRCGSPPSWSALPACWW